MTPRTVSTLYCDDAILVIDKPSGLPVHPSSRYLHGTVVGRLREQYGDNFAAPVHRLDRETSGVMICARHRQAASTLGKAFARHAIAKEYTAICCGDLGDVHQFTSRAPLAIGGAVVRIGVRVDASGKDATTHFTRLARFERDGQVFTVWRAVPETGRRHQIRAHLRHAGIPVVGDKIYGPDENYYVQFCTDTLDAAAWQRLLLPRQALHAACITLTHPTSGASVRYEAPLPEDLRMFLRSADPARRDDASGLLQ